MDVTLAIVKVASVWFKNLQALWLWLYIKSWFKHYFLSSNSISRNIYINITPCLYSNLSSRPWSSLPGLISMYYLLGPLSSEHFRGWVVVYHSKNEDKFPAGMVWPLYLTFISPFVWTLFSLELWSESVGL